MTSFLSRFFGPPLPSLSAKDLFEKTKGSKRPLILDVREAVEYRAGHILGAKLIPLGELKKKMKELPLDKEIVCVCATGSRSHSATSLLMGNGYKVINLNGGMNVWERSGFPVKKGTAA